MAEEVRASPVGAGPQRVLTLATLPYYLGGFLGPFGTMVVIPIYPELRDSFDATSEQVNWAFSGYMIPMALLMIVSGTIGERFGRRRVTMITFVCYSLASVLCVVAPTLGWFVAARVLQGCANAFISPLLIAGLTEVTAPRQLGRALGVYSSFQAGGAAFAPLAGGLAALVDWRWVFVLVAAISAVLATRPPPGEPRPAASAPPIRPLLTRRMMKLWVAAFTAAAGPLGAGVLVGLYLRDELDTGSATAGSVLLVGGLTAMLAGPRFGALLDVWGPAKASAVSLIGVIVFIVPVGFAPGVPSITVLWVGASAFVGFTTINLQNLAATAVPDNRGGALSTVLGFRFLGHAVGPLLLVPLFDVDAAWAFALAGAIGVVTFVTMVGAARTASEGTSGVPAG